MLNCCIYNLKGVRTMERTYVDITGECYDHFEEILDLGYEVDMRVYDPKNWISKNIIQIG